MLPASSAETAALLGGVLLSFAALFAFRAFRVQQIEHARRRRRGDEARLPASEGVAEASQGAVREEQAGVGARRELLPHLAAADAAAAQALIAPEQMLKGVLRRPRGVTFAPELASEVEIYPNEELEEEGVTDESRPRILCPHAPRRPALRSVRPCAT